MSSPEVVGIYVSEKPQVLPAGVSSARAEAGRGLEGDRYWNGTGSFSDWKGSGRALTLVEAEALDDVGLDWAAARRNVVTRGADLNDAGRQDVPDRGASSASEGGSASRAATSRSSRATG